MKIATKPFKQRIATFNRYRQQMDPQGRFRDEYFKGLFAPAHNSIEDKHSFVAKKEAAEH